MPSPPKLQKQAKTRAIVDRKTWEMAIEDVRSGRLSIRMAACTHKLSSPSALARRIKGMVGIICRPGPKPSIVTATQESAVIEIIRFRAKRGMCPSTSELKQLFRDAAAKNGDVSKKFPDAHWMASFRKRHKNVVCERKSQILDSARAEASTPESIERFHDNLRAAIDEFHITPDRFFNCDETGVCPQGTHASRVMSRC